MIHLNQLKHFRDINRTIINSLLVKKSRKRFVSQSLLIFSGISGHTASTRFRGEQFPLRSQDPTQRVWLAWHGLTPCEHPGLHDTWHIFRPLPEQFRCLSHIRVLVRNRAIFISIDDSLQEYMCVDPFSTPSTKTLLLQWSLPVGEVVLLIARRIRRQSVPLFWWNHGPVPSLHAEMPAVRSADPCSVVLNWCSKLLSLFEVAPSPLVSIHKWLCWRRIIANSRQSCCSTAQ